MSETTTTTGVEDEYEHLRTKQREQAGNVEEGRIRDAYVGRDTVSLTVEFDWTTRTERLGYDLNDERDILKLEAIAEANGLAFEQLGHLEGMRIDLQYTGDGWVPTDALAHVEGEGSASETFRTELSLLVREVARSPRFLRGGVHRIKNAGTNEIIVGVIAFKKIPIAIALAALLLGYVL